MDSEGDWERVRVRDAVRLGVIDVDPVDVAVELEDADWEGVRVGVSPVVTVCVGDGVSDGSWLVVADCVRDTDDVPDRDCVRLEVPTGLGLGDGDRVPLDDVVTEGVLVRVMPVEKVCDGVRACVAVREGTGVGSCVELFSLSTGLDEADDDGVLDTLAEDDIEALVVRDALELGEDEALGVSESVVVGVLVGDGVSVPDWDCVCDALPVGLADCVTDAESVAEILGVTVGVWVRLALCDAVAVREAVTDAVCVWEAEPLAVCEAVCVWLGVWLGDCDWLLVWLGDCV